MLFGIIFAQKPTLVHSLKNRFFQFLDPNYFVFYLAVSRDASKKELSKYLLSNYQMLTVSSWITGLVEVCAPNLFPDSSRIQLSLHDRVLYLLKFEYIKAWGLRDSITLRKILWMKTPYYIPDKKNTQVCTKSVQTFCSNGKITVQLINFFSEL